MPFFMIWYSVVIFCDEACSLALPPCLLLVLSSDSVQSGSPTFLCRRHGSCLQEQSGLYVKAAERLHLLAEAADAFMRARASSEQEAIGELCSGREHGQMLLAISKRFCPFVRGRISVSTRPLMPFRPQTSPKTGPGLSTTFH